MALGIGPAIELWDRLRYRSLWKESSDSGNEVSRFKWRLSFSMHSAT